MAGMNPATFTSNAIPVDDWREVAVMHLERAKGHTIPARERHTRHEPHPIEDFLFDYYPFPLSLLEKWHPGVGTALVIDGDIPEQLRSKHYRVTSKSIEADPACLTEKERLRLGYMIEILEATRDRAPNFGCHGLHEWAMVYRGKEIRHKKTLSLRLPQHEIDNLVQSRPIYCSHHDAYRFFVEDAKAFNLLQPTLETRAEHEQPACLHANMDLYKWAAKAMPWVGSRLLLDCFELALDLRDLDMRASPYDMTPWGRDPVRIETPEGRRQYEKEQRKLAERAKPLRQRLIDSLKDVLA